MKLRLFGSTALLPTLSKISIAVALAGALAFTGPAPLAMAKSKTIPYASPLASGAPVSFADLIEEISPSVVSISVETREDAPSVKLPEGFDQLPEQFREFFRRQQPGSRGPSRPREGRALGSGFLISKEGHVVTNNHVVEHATKITVTMQDGREFKAELIGKDKLTDLAVLKIEDDKDFPHVSFAENVKLRVGDWVVAVGNPFGLGGTATAGIVSATGREIGSSTYNDFIQVDASINRGNSGGPTFDLYGNVVGVNSQILSPTGGNIGIGFAIPARIAAKVTRELIDKGKITRGYLGVNIQSIDQDIADSEGLKSRDGALVARVVEDSPAEKAGFKTGDIVLRLDGKPIKDSRDLTQKVGELFVGHKAKFVILRNGKRKNLTVNIGKRPDNLGNEGSSDVEKPDANEFGMMLGSLSPEDHDRLDLEGDRGILVERVDTSGSAYKKGIRAGNALLAAGSTDLHSPKDFDRAIENARKAGKKAIRILVQNRNGQLFTALRLDEPKSDDE
jgi:serine protease Do